MRGAWATPGHPSLPAGSPAFPRFPSPLGGRAPRDYRSRPPPWTPIPPRRAAAPGAAAARPGRARPGLPARPAAGAASRSSRWAWPGSSPRGPAPWSFAWTRELPAFDGPQGLPPARLHAGPGRRRQRGLRLRAGAAHRRPLRQDPRRDEAGGARRRGRALLRARGRELPGHRPLRGEGAPARRRGLRRLHHHPAGGEDLPPLHRLAGEAQGEGADPRPQARAEPHQGRDPLPLPEPDLHGAPALRRGGGVPVLLRQGDPRCHRG